MRAKKTKSTFAEALRRLLDESHMFTRKDWAIVLDVSASAISQWVNDVTIPRAEHLRGIVRLVEESPSTPRDVLEQFWEMSARPIREVTPLGKRLPERTVGHFIMRPLWEGFLRVFQPLSPVEQTRVIVAAGQMCREFTRGWVARGYAEKFAGPLAVYPGGVSTQVEYVEWLEKYAAGERLP